MGDVLYIGWLSESWLSSSVCCNNYVQSLHLAVASQYHWPVVGPPKLTQKLESNIPESLS